MQSLRRAANAHARAKAHTMTVHFILAVHALVFGSVAIGILVLALREPYISEVLALPAFIALAVACAFGVAWWIN